MNTKMAILQALWGANLFVSLSNTPIRMPIKHIHVEGMSPNQGGHCPATQVKLVRSPYSVSILGSTPQIQGTKPIELRISSKARHVENIFLVPFLQRSHAPCHDCNGGGVDCHLIYAVPYSYCHARHLGHPRKTPDEASLFKMCHFAMEGPIIRCGEGCWTGSPNITLI